MIPIFHKYDFTHKKIDSLKIAPLRDRAIAQFIDGIFLSLICNVIFIAFSSGKLYSIWVSPIIPQFIMEVKSGYVSESQQTWWGGNLFSFVLPYGKVIFLNYPSPLIFLVYGLYYTIFSARFSQSPGKMLKRLVVLRDDGQRSDVKIAFTRWIFSAISLVPLGAGFWRASKNSGNQTFHDKICNTKVYYFE
jgi:uncharacterized RDD family membrane protein YckC